MKKEQFIDQLRKAFDRNFDEVHLSDVAEWMGLAAFNEAKKYADSEGNIKLKEEAGNNGKG